MNRLRALLEGTRKNADDRERGGLTALEQEFLPPVLEIQETPPSPLKRQVVWSIVLLVTVLLVWATVGRIEVASMANGKFIPDGKIKVIQPMETSIVRAIHVHEGQRVKTGDLLLELDPTINAADLEASRKRLAIAKEREANARPLVGIGALSRQDYLQIKQDLATAEGDITKARERYELGWLRSPVDGLVQSVNVTTLGAVVTSAQPLVTIVPLGSSLVVEAMLSNADVGFVKIGQRAEIKVDTFPFQKYGTIGGTLVWVSPDAEDKSARAGESSDTPPNVSGTENRGDPRNTEYLYRVHIKPDTLTMRVDGQDAPLTSGMSVKVDIMTDNRRVIEFFLSPVIKYLDEGMKVR